MSATDRISIAIKTILICTVFISACSKNEAITVAGSTTVLPVATRTAERFRLSHPGIHIIINAGGSGVGINQLGTGKIDIGMASRHITDTEIRKYPKVHFVTHAIGRDAVVPVVSSEVYNAGVTALTLAQIGEIYKGEISNWKSVGGPDKEILAVDKEKSRGTRHVFMQAVLGDEEAAAPGADLVLGSNNEEQTAIAQSDAAIGMLSNAWMNDDVKGLAIIMPDGAVIEPTLTTITDGAFPITRDLLLITNGPAQGTSKAFIDFILSREGQKIVAESDYVPVNR
ncbi:MAG: phosphate ABC transporter substrate-binding protein [Gammaproteobacteria bacterium]